LGLTRFLRRLEKRYRNAEGLPITLSVDLFFSFRSPYSYLALPKTMKVAADYDVTVNLRSR
jgi:2-hydroxychromene-2-carboxylate isomerase